MMNNNTNDIAKNDKIATELPNDKASNLNNMDALSQYLKASASSRVGRAIPPLETWHPKEVVDMDLVIKANGEWWHEGGKMTRQSLVDLFATILWREENQGVVEYFLKTPVQKIRIQVEDAPLLINDVGIVNEGHDSWLEFTTTTGDVVRLDGGHHLTLKAYYPTDNSTETDSRKDNENHQAVGLEAQVRPYMLVRNGLMALIGRNAFYHLTDIGQLTEQNGETVLTLQSGGQAYSLSMPAS